jgi:hypothetical protein
LTSQPESNQLLAHGLRLFAADQGSLDGHTSAAGVLIGEELSGVAERSVCLLPKALYNPTAAMGFSQRVQIGKPF